MPVLDRCALKNNNGLPYLEVPQLAGIDWIRHAFLTRNGGTSPDPFRSLNLSTATGDSEGHVSENKRRIASAFDFEPDRLMLLRQIHEDRILILREPFAPPPSSPEYDGMIAHAPNRFLAIKTADCLPILIVDRTRKVIAAVHAGRQGTARHIARKVLKTMALQFNCSSRDLVIALGPSIGPCCYEIDEKVFLPEWEPFSIPQERGKWRVDLAGINTAQLREDGIGEDQIIRIDLCTRCHPDLFFSYRGEGRTGRQLSFIGVIDV
jgi:YfiH family protein